MITEDSTAEPEARLDGVMAPKCISLQMTIHNYLVVFSMGHVCHSV